MAESNLIFQIVGGVLSGGAAAFGTLSATFRGIKNRITVLETRVGSPDENPKTGLFATVTQLGDGLQNLRRTIDGWQDAPPEWMFTLVRKVVARTTSSFAIDATDVDRFAARTRSDIERIEQQLDNISRQYVERSEYDHDARARVEELSKIREQIADIKGLLRGVMSMLKYQGSPTQDRVNFIEPEPSDKFGDEGYPKNQKR